MSFFEDLFEASHRRGHGREHGHGHHEHDDDHDFGDRYYQPNGGRYGAPPPSSIRPASAPCPRCSAVVPLLPGARFCAACGAPFAAEPTCRSCGSGLTPGAAFCQGCGAKVS